MYFNQSNKKIALYQGPHARQRSGSYKNHFRCNWPSLLKANRYTTWYKPAGASCDGLAIVNK